MVPKLNYKAVILQELEGPEKGLYDRFPSPPQVGEKECPGKVLWMVSGWCSQLQELAQRMPAHSCVRV